MIMPQKPAQTGLALDLRWIGRTGVRRRHRNGSDCPVFNSLMRANRVVIPLVLSDQELQMAFPKHYELADALVLYTLNEPFGKRVQVGRGVGQPLHLDPLPSKNLAEFLRELGIAIFDQVGGFLAPLG